MKSEESKTSPYQEIAKFIVTNIADDHDNSFISQKMIEVVLKPLLEDYISSGMKSEFPFKQEWFA